MASLEPFRIVESQPALHGSFDPAVLLEPGSPPREPRPTYTYEGPSGPVHEGYVDAGTVTRLWGPDVPPTMFSIGSPDRVGALQVSRQLDAGLTGRIGERPVVVRAAPAPGPFTRELEIAVGDAPVEPYRLRAVGLLARVALHRSDETAVATFSVRGRKPHRILADARPVEVVLAMFLTRFVAALAHRR
jgi:hypothetical protein